MFKHIVKTAIVAAFIAIGSLASAQAGDDGSSDTFATMFNKDGSSVTSRRTRRGRTVTRRNKHGKVVKVRKYRKNSRVRRGPGINRPPRGPRGNPRPRGRSWAHNHTTGVTSVGVRPGLRVVIGGGGISLSF
jgi:Ni/Co efflux regulator RcnB